MSTRLKLALGQIRRAWEEYPTIRRNVREASPGPTLLVTGMYRSGTTWIGTMLSAPGMWHVHEPFHPNQGLWERELTYTRFDRPNPEIDRLLAELESGRHVEVVRLPYSGKWFSPIRLLPLRPQRVLIKDPSAALMSAYLAERHEVEALVVFRHPAGVVGSFLRLGWPTGRMVARFLENEELMETRLQPFIGMIERATRREDLFSGTVLYGCVNRVLWDFTEKHTGSMRRLIFEDLCEDPLERFRVLYDALRLPYDVDVHARHETLCFSGASEIGQYRTHQVRRSSAAMRERWKNEMSRAAADEIRATWERFRVPLYDSPEDWGMGKTEEEGRG